MENQNNKTSGCKTCQAIDTLIVSWMSRYGLTLLRYSVAIIFIWFGFLKPLGISPAEELVASTVPFFPREIFVPFLGWWEVLIGVCFLFRSTIRAGLVLMFLQMPGTFLPMVLFPETCFTHAPFGLTLEGQYIVKNLVLISAALVIGGSLANEKGQG